jgi:hypothetical protein
MVMAERVEGIERITLAADKAYDTKDFVSEMRGMKVTPHVSQNTKRPGTASRTGNSTVGIYVHGYGLQPGTDAEFDVAGSSVCISPRRAAFSVFRKGVLGTTRL